MPGITYSLGLNSGPFRAGLGAAQAALACFRGLATTIGGLGGLVGALTGGASAALALKSAITGAANAETLQLQFETLLKSAGAARRLTAELETFSDATPFDMPDVAPAARTLLAFGGTSKTVISELRMLGDIASVSGSTIGELAQVFGKVRVQGRLSGEVIEQFTVRGIPLIAMLAEQLGKSAEEVRKMVEDGKIGFPQVSAVMAELTSEGGRFFEGTKKLAGSAGGLWSTFQGNIRRVLQAFGGPVLVELKTALAGAIQLASGLVARAQQFGETVATWVRVGRELFATGELGSAVGLALKIAFMEGANILTAALRATLANAGTVLGGALKGLVGLLSNKSHWAALFDGLRSAGAAVADAIAVAIRSTIPGMEITQREQRMRRMLRTDIGDMIPGFEQAAQKDPRLAEIGRRFGIGNDMDWMLKIAELGKIEGDLNAETTFKHREALLAEAQGIMGAGAQAEAKGLWANWWEDFRTGMKSGAKLLNTAPLIAKLNQTIAGGLASDSARRPGGIAGMALFITQALEESRAAIEGAASEFAPALAGGGGLGGGRRALTDRLREIGGFIGGQGPVANPVEKEMLTVLKRSDSKLEQIERATARLNGGVFT